MGRRPRYPGLCLLLALLTGCGRGGTPTYEVSGTVTWNGKSLPEGDIVFYPVDGAVAPDAGKVVDGRFHFRARAGRKRVEIRASREEGPIDPVMKSVPRRSYIPRRYNDRSALTADVTPGGDNRYVFELTDKP
jgi:hypothetical protein